MTVQPPSSPAMPPVPPPPLREQPSATPPADGVVEDTTSRLDVSQALLGLWFTVGMFVDAWAHHRGLPEDFWTPWHGLLYSGYLVVALDLLWALRQGVAAGRPWRRALPAAYRPSLAGAAVFALGGVGDAVWHTLFGVEADVDAIFSPSHLALSIGAMLLLAGPLRAAWRRGGSLRQAGWGRAWPAILSLTYSLLLLHFFLQFAHPYVEAWPAVQPRQDRRVGRLYLADETGRGARLLDSPGLDAQMPEVDPEGRSLVFSATVADVDDAADPADGDHHGPRAALYRLDLRDLGAPPVPLLADEEADLFQPALSPDGRRLAYLRADEHESALWLAGADGDGAEPLELPAAEGGLDLEAPRGPAWSPDGRRLAFSARVEGQSEVFAYDLEAEELVRLTEDAAEDRHPAWSPDGSRLAFASDRSGEGFQLYRMDAEGGPAGRLSDAAWLLAAAEAAGRPNREARVSRWPRLGGAEAWAPRWSPDGERLLAITNAAGEPDLLLLDVADGEARLLEGAPGLEELGGRWLPRAEGIVYQAAPGGPSIGYMSQAIGSLGQLSTALALAGVLLFALARWPWPGLPGGAVALVMGLNAAAMAPLEEEWRMLGAGLVSALLLEALHRWLRPDPAAVRRFRLFAFLAPCLYLLVANLAVLLTEGMGWTVHLWTGTAVMAGLGGVLLSFLVTGLAGAEGGEG